MHQHFVLVVRVVRPLQMLGDVGVFFLHAGQHNLLRFDHQRRGQLGFARGKCRREHQCLLAMLARIGNRVDLIRETQIEHAIGFVQHQGMQLRQVNSALLYPVQQTTGRGHDQLRAF